MTALLIPSLCICLALVQEPDMTSASNRLPLGSLC